MEEQSRMRRESGVRNKDCNDESVRIIYRIALCRGAKHFWRQKCSKPFLFPKAALRSCPFQKWQKHGLGPVKRPLPFSSAFYMTEMN